MGNYFIKDKKIILYATGGLSCKVEKLFKENGREIEVYIDRRAKDIQFFHDKKVFSINEAEESLQEKDEYVVIITTKNVFEHSKIATELRRKGFINIIYKDYGVLQGRKEKAIVSIDNAFENILNQNCIPENEIETIEDSTLNLICDEAYIREENGMTYAYIPANMIFTNCIDNWIWSRVNFKTAFFIIDMYKEFELGRSQIREVSRKYIHEFAEKGAEFLNLNTNGEWKNYVISGRMEVFREMNDLFCRTPEFFVENCPAVSGNANNGFELISSGKNRVAFLMAKGYKYIPLRISKEEYSEFTNGVTAKKIEAYIKRENIAEFKVPVLHPFFYKYASKAPDYYELWLERVGKDITYKQFNAKENFDLSGQSIRIECRDNGAAERYFAMLGLQVFNEVEKDELTLLLDELFYYQDKKGKDVLCYDYSVIYDEDNIKPILERTMKTCYLAGESIKMENMIVDLDMKVYNVEEIFVTFWDKKEYSGFAIRKVQGE